MSNIEELRQYLKEKNCAISGFTVHPDHEPTAEQIAGEILRSMKALENGEYTTVEEVFPELTNIRI